MYDIKENMIVCNVQKIKQGYERSRFFVFFEFDNLKFKKYGNNKKR